MTGANFRRVIAIAFWVWAFVAASFVVLATIVAVHFVIKFW